VAATIATASPVDGLGGLMDGLDGLIDGLFSFFFV
jgi:hypothetical protein